MYEAGGMALTHSRASLYFTSLPGLVFTGAFLCTLSFNADAADYSAYSSHGADFSLSLEKTESRRANTGGNSRLYLNRIRLTAYEPAYQWIQGGLHLGYADIERHESAVGAQTHPSGQFIGIQLRYPQNPERQVRPHVLASYTYYQLKADSDSISRRLTLHEYHAEAGLAWRPGLVDMSAGGYYTDLDGSEEYSGASNGSQSITMKENAGYFASLGYWLDSSGRIGITGQRGATNSFFLVFSRYY